MSLYTKIPFERDICAHLAANGQRYAERDTQAYDTARALFPPDVLAWVQATQTQAWMAVPRQSHDAAGLKDILLGQAQLYEALRDQGSAS